MKIRFRIDYLYVKLHYRNCSPE